MERVRLGRSDLIVSRIGLGGCPFGGHGWGPIDDENSLRAIRAAVDAGINFFDTADVYGLGHSEQILARGLGAKRTEMVVATKFGVRWDDQKRIVKDISPRYLRTALEASLRRLQLDCIPLYYVHWPDGATPVEAAVEELARCRQEGKIHAIGISNFSAEQIESAGAAAEVACLQAQYSLVDRGAEALASAVRRTQISLVTWGSLAQGLLAGKYDASSRFGADDRRSRYENFRGDKFIRNLQTVEAVKRVAARAGKTPAQVAVRWLLDSPLVSCALLGAKSPQQVRDNAGAAGWRLSDEEFQELATAGNLAGGPDRAVA